MQGGSATTYPLLQQVADLFNAAPGCDLASSSGTPQALDLGLPGPERPRDDAVARAQTTAVTGTVTKKKTTITLTSGTTTGFFANDAGERSRGAGAIPAGAVISQRD